MGSDKILRASVYGPEEVTDPDFNRNQKPLRKERLSYVLLFTVY